MAEEQIAFVLWPAVVTGLAIGVYEAFMLMKDVTVPTHKWSHAAHSLVLTTFFAFCSINAEWAIATFGLSNIAFISNPWMLRIALGLIGVIKIHTASAVNRSIGTAAGLGETWFHSLFVGVLIVVSPYIAPFVANFLPGSAPAANP